MKHHIHARSWADQQRIARRERLFDACMFLGAIGIGICVTALVVILLSSRGVS